MKSVIILTYTGFVSLCLYFLSLYILHSIGIHFDIPKEDHLSYFGFTESSLKAIFILIAISGFFIIKTMTLNVENKEGKKDEAH